MAYAHIMTKLLSSRGLFSADGYTTEEQKLIDETRKILEDQEVFR